MNQIVPHLFVNSVTDNINFYKNVLGFEPIYVQTENDENNFAILKNKNVQVMVGASEILYKYAPEFVNKPLVNSSILYFEMDGVKDYYNKVKDKADIVRELNETWYNTKEFWIKDCNGNLLAFYENI